MKKRITVVVLAAISSTVWAAPKTVTVSVPALESCGTCPFTVRESLRHVAGVEQTAFNFDKKQVVVTFDDTKTSVGALTQATTNAGYPSSAVK